MKVPIDLGGAFGSPPRIVHVTVGELERCPSCRRLLTPILTGRAHHAVTGRGRDGSECHDTVATMLHARAIRTDRWRRAHGLD